MTQMEIVLMIVSMIKMVNSCPECHVIQLGKKCMLLTISDYGSMVELALKGP